MNFQQFLQHNTLSEDDAQNTQQNAVPATQREQEFTLFMSILVPFVKYIGPNRLEKMLLNFCQKKYNLNEILKTDDLTGRDDITIKINGFDASLYGSQGQQRTIALSIKLGLSRYIKKESKKMIVLLDDVFGELDNKRQTALLNAVDQGTQVLITTTSIDNIENEIIKRSKVIKLEEKGDLNG